MAAKKALEVGDVLPKKNLIELGQFYKRDNSLYCVRPSCEGCDYDPLCTRTDEFIRIGPGINIRQAFRVRPGFKWACIDFAGIELRVAAQLSGEPVWVEAFQDDVDLHSAMARIMFRVEEPDKAQRDIAKMGNFGNLYLASVDTFWKLTDLSYVEAVKAYKDWWLAVPVYKKWTKNQIEYYKQHGHVWTFFKRKREMRAMIAAAEGNSGNGKPRVNNKKLGMGFCDRTSVNSPVQGTSADLLKLAMVRVTNFIEKQKLQDEVRVMLTVHDELDFEIRDTPRMYEILREIGRQMTMTPKGATLPTIQGWMIPLKVDIEIGDNWGNLVNIDDLDPETKDLSKPEKAAPKRDEVVLVVSALTDEDRRKLHLAMYQAANIKDVILVPLKIKMGDRVYTSKDLKKVSEGHLRQMIQDIPGVDIL